MSPCDPYFEIISHDSTIYEGSIDSKLILVHKGVLVIMHNIREDSE